MGKKVGKKQGLPKGWQEVRVGEVFMLSRGRVISKKEIQSNSGIFPVYSSKTYDNGKLGSINTYDFDGDYLTWTTDGANAGSVFYRKGKFNCTNVCGVAKSMYPDRIDCQFVSYFLQDKTQKYVSYVGNPKLMNNTFAEIMIQFPPFLKQKAIASLLETWDTAIEKTEALIAAKEKQFKWLLKTLISDQQNSPKWTAAKLGNICKIRKGEQLNKLQMVETGKYPALNGGVAPSGYTDGWNTPENTVTISEGGNSCGYVNLNTSKFWAGGHCYTLTGLADEISTDFLYYQLKREEPSIMKLRVGSGLPNIQKGDIDKYPIFFPTLAKQKQIAHILNTAQREIDSLKQLAEQRRTQKRGLMQKLLTGEWRTSTPSFLRKQESRHEND